MLLLVLASGAARADDAVLGRWAIEGRYSNGRRTAGELTFERQRDGRLRVTRTARVGPDRCGAPTVTWTSTRITLTGARAEVEYEAPSGAPAPGLVDVLLGRADEKRAAQTNRLRGRYVVVGDALREVVTNETRHAPEDGWRRVWTTGRRLLPTLKLRVMTFNIHHGEGEDGRLDLGRIARTISCEAVDLVALQEVDRGTERARRVDQPRELGRLTGLSHAYGPNLLGFQGGEYGNAVLSRLAAVRSQNHPLPKEEGREQRGLLDVTLTARFGARVQERLRVLSTHLEVGSASNRMQQALVIRDLVRAAPEQPMVLAGDLNSEPDSIVLGALRAQGWVVAGAPQTFETHPAPRPRRQIDYVLVRPAARWRHVSTRVAGNGVDSDHRPLVSEVELLPPPAR